MNLLIKLVIKYANSEKLCIILSLEQMQLHLDKFIRGLIRHLEGKILSKLFGICLDSDISKTSLLKFPITTCYIWN